MLVSRMVHLQQCPFSRPPILPCFGPPRHASHHLQPSLGIADRFNITFDFLGFTKQKTRSKSYGWWKKSCTGWYGKFPIIIRVLYIQTVVGLGISEPPTSSILFFFRQSKWEVWVFNVEGYNCLYPAAQGITLAWKISCHLNVLLGGSFRRPLSSGGLEMNLQTRKWWKETFDVNGSTRTNCLYTLEKRPWFKK